MGATRELARYVAEARYADLPDQVVWQAKRAIRDSVGCLLGGSVLAAGQQQRDLFLPLAAEGECTVAGSRRRIPPAFASYIHAQLTNLMDYDDTLEGKALGHPGATIIPAALALAEAQKASGAQFIASVVVGYDAYTRVAVAGKPSFERSKQVRSLGTWQVFSTVATAASLLGLDPEATARAFGLAVLHTPVPFVAKIYEERPMWALKNNYGWVTMGGVLAAQYARAGLEANHSILEGNTGFWAMAGSDHFEPDQLTANLGREYSVLDVSFKPYSSCRHTHSPLDALRQILQSNPIQAEQVRAVRLSGGSKIRVFADFRPRTGIDAEFSLPYVVAMMLLGEPTGFRWVDSGRWCDPAVLAVADRVQIEVDPEAEAQLAKGYMRARVSLELANGQVLGSEATVARGHPQNPLSDSELQVKFLTLAEAAIGPERARELDRRLMRLEELDEVRELTEYLHP